MSTAIITHPYRILERLPDDTSDSFYALDANGDLWSGFWSPYELTDEDFSPQPFGPYR